MEPGAGASGAVVAYVAVSGGPRGSRMFRVDGPANAPNVHELGAATTVDLSRFDREAAEELQPAIDEIQALGGMAAIAKPRAEWICDEVKAFLKAKEGLSID